MNILSNAIDSIEKKGTITITTKKLDGMINIIIKDTGRGIPKGYREKIFEPFFTTKEVGKGTGLGLSISHGIIKRHNGTIDFRSGPEGGTEFIIEIPVSRKAG
jgi:signal transduction histidine kinase